MNSYIKLKKKIQSKNIKIGVIGLGYVGLPLSLTISERGYKVYGFDKDINKIKSLYKFKSYIKHVSNIIIKKLIKKKLFITISQFNFLKSIDIIILCVPTPLTKNKKPDLTYIKNSVDLVFKYFKPGKKIILESTTYPGTCKDLIIDKLKKQKLTEGIDYYLSYSPEERILEIKNFKP